jgi:hypothetical protein
MGAYPMTLLSATSVIRRLASNYLRPSLCFHLEPRLGTISFERSHTTLWQMESESSTLGKRPAEDIQESEKSKVPRADSVTPAPAESSAIKEPTEGTSSQSAKRSSKAGKSRPPERARRGTRTEPRPEGEERTPRLPKRQCALLIGFSGTGYSGMQM